MFLWCKPSLPDPWVFSVDPLLAGLLLWHFYFPIMDLMMSMVCSVFWEICFITQPSSVFLHNIVSNMCGESSCCLLLALLWFGKIKLATYVCTIKPSWVQSQKTASSKSYILCTEMSQIRHLITFTPLYFQWSVLQQTAWILHEINKILFLSFDQ